MSTERTWLAWGVDVGLLPNKEETNILLVLAVVGLGVMVLYYRYTGAWYMKRIHDDLKEKQAAKGACDATTAAQQQESSAEPPVEGEATAQVEASPVQPTPTEAPQTVPHETVAQMAAQMAHEDIRNSWRLPDLPAAKHGKDHTVPVMRKVLTNTGAFISAYSPIKSRRRADGEGKKSYQLSKSKSASARVQPSSSSEAAPAALQIEGPEVRKHKTLRARLSPILLSPKRREKKEGAKVA